MTGQIAFTLVSRVTHWCEAVPAHLKSLHQNADRTEQKYSDRTPMQRPING